MKKIQAMIIDDDSNSIDLIAKYINLYCPLLENNYNATSVSKAITNIKIYNPDIIFLDIKLENQLGFDILDAINDSKYPEIIFISAHTNFAVKAIQYRPVNYLVKPILIQDFIYSVNKAVHNLVETDHDYSMDSLALNIGKKIDFISFDEIIYLESDGNYTKVHTKKEAHHGISNIGKIEEKLPRNFFRIHKKFIVNLNFIYQIYTENNFYCVMKNKKILPIARRKQKDLKLALKL